MSNTSAIRVHAIVNESVVDGPGLRSVIFVQGCPHACPGCHNPQTWAFEGGEILEADEVFKRFNLTPLTQGVTFSGGEPFWYPEGLSELAKLIKANGLDLWVYTGYTIEQLVRLSVKRPAVKVLLDQCDCLVDGRFILGERDLTLLFRGSRNQRLLKQEDIQKAFAG